MKDQIAYLENGKGYKIAELPDELLADLYQSAYSNTIIFHDGATRENVLLRVEIEYIIRRIDAEQAKR